MSQAVGNGNDWAKLEVFGGEHLFANGLNIASNATLAGAGLLRGAITNLGSIAPGHSTGLLSFANDLVLQDLSSEDLQLAGLATNSYDRLAISGTLQVAGILNVTFADGYVPVSGDIFNLFDYTAVSGVFAQTNLPDFGDGRRWDTSHLLTDPSDPLSGSLLVIPEPAVMALFYVGLGVLWLRRRWKTIVRPTPPLLPVPPAPAEDRSTPVAIAPDPELIGEFIWELTIEPVYTSAYQRSTDEYIWD